MEEKPRKMGIGVGIMILRDGKVLLGKRHDDPAKADSELHGEGTWTMPGGKLHFGESFEQAAAREVAEETGLRISGIELVSVTNDVSGDAHFVTIGFLCDKFQGEPKVMEPDEITRWEWFALDKIPRPIFPPSEKILKNYSAKRVYSRGMDDARRIS
jgi:8-oxo-dGTP diphosphatase